MKEMTMNNTCMYDEVEEIRNLNKVEGFDPRKYMRLIPNEGQTAKYYLDVAYRKLWFRLRYIRRLREKIETDASHPQHLPQALVPLKIPGG